MAGNNVKVKGQVDLSVNVQTENARQQLIGLQKELTHISNLQTNIGATQLFDPNLQEVIMGASKAALELKSHLAAATNVDTGKLDFSKFAKNLDVKTLQHYSDALLQLGPQGNKAFLGLANSIAQSEIPLKRTSKLLDTTWDNLKKTAGWQLSSSIIHGFIGSVQQAVGYAQDLNKSLTDIRIVTGASTEQMARFAEQANKAAKNLSTTTTDYTKASLIYYQQGLSDQEVKARTETTIKMANATGTSAQKVSDQMTAIWNNYDNGTKSLTHYADVMTALGAATASSTDEIAQGLQKFASISETVGLSYEYAASALATVTATSRESADVVGNSFKTLFSRIQGLQLGETLEDGTDLNKYSSALATVGISIKDTSGDLKDMDDILNEMGESWSSLERDEKMALAQTVAGVRQYTQLMTLMENWDTFKKNLNIANSSEGTLDSQAAIYAESWEAAQNRVRASWEGLWDSLINSDSFISILDGFSGLINLAEGLVDSLGGAGGTLAAFGGILTQIFKPQIAKTINDTALAIRSFSPKARQEDISKRDEMLKILAEPFGDDGDDGSYARRAIKTSITEQAKESANREKRRRYMDDQQLYLDDLINKQRTEIQGMRIENAKERDAAEQSRELQGNIYKDSLDKDYRYQDPLEFLNNKKAKLQNEIDNINDIVTDPTYKLKENETAEQAAARELEARKKTISEIDKSIKKTDSYFNDSQKKVLSNFEKNKTSRKDVIDKVAEQALEFQDFFDKEFWDTVGSEIKDPKPKDYESLKNGIKAYIAKNIDTNLINIDDIDTIEAFKGEGSKDKNNKAIREYIERITSGALDAVIYGARGIDNDEEIIRYGQSVKETIRTKNKDTQLNTIDDDLQQRSKQNEKAAERLKNIESFAEGAEGVMMLVSSGQSLAALMESLSEGTATFSSGLMGVVSTLATGAAGFGQLTNALSMIPSLGASAASGIGLVVTALMVLGPMIADWFDKISTSSQEHLQNLAMSNNELTTATNSTNEAVKNAKTQNEDYLKGIEKIKSLNHDPVQLAEDIFESNKKALSLITEYGLQQGIDYITNNNGLIDIKEESLNAQIDKKSSTATNADYAEIIGTALNKQATNIEKLTHTEISAMSNDQNLRFNPAGARWMLDKEEKDFYDRYDKNKDSIFNADELKELYANGEWESFRKAFSQLEGTVGDNLVKRIEQNIADSNIKQSDAFGVTNASMVVANQLLKDNGYTSENLEGYSAIAHNMAQQMSEQYLQEWIPENKIDTVDDNKSYRDDIIRMLEEHGIAENATIVSAKDGRIGYKAEGSTETAYISRETLNAWKAAEEVTNNATNLINSAKDQYNNEIKKLGGEIKETEKLAKTAGEASLSITEFQSALGASADSVYALFQLQKNGNAHAQQQWGLLDETERTKLEKIFGDDGVVKTLGLDENTLSQVSTGSLENLQKEMENLGENGGKYLKELLDSIIDAGNLEGNSEAIAQVVTALSNLDLNDNAYLNLLKIKNALESFNIDIDLSALDGVYQWLQNILKIAKGFNSPDENKNPEDTINEILSNRKALNQIAPKAVVDEDTKISLQKAGLSENDFIPNGEGGYTYIGSQSEINYAKKMANEAYLGEYSRIASAKTMSQTLSKSGINLANSYSDKGALYKDLDLSNYIEMPSLEEWNNLDPVLQQRALKHMGAADYSDLLVKAAEMTQHSNMINDLENQLGYEEGAFKKILETGTNDEINQLLSDINNFQQDASSDLNTAGIQEYLASMSSAQEIFEASTKFDVLRDEHGALSDDTLKAIQALPETSERASVAIDQLVASKENLYRVEQELNDALEEGTMTSEEADAAMESAILAYEQAEANAALQSSIDAVAEARGLDAEAVAFYAEQIQDSLSAEDEATLGPSNIADMAADLAEQQEAITGLNNEWSKLSQLINQTDMTLDKSKALNSFADYIDKLTNSSLTAGKSVEALNKSWQQFKNMGGDMSKVLKGDIKEITKLSRAFGDMEKKVIKVNKEGKNYGKTYEQMFEQVDNALGKLKNPKEESVLGPEDFMGDPAEQQAAYDDLLDAVYDTLIQEMQDNGGDFEAAAEKVGSQFGVNIGKGVKEGEQAEIGDGSADVVATPTEGEASNLQPEIGEPGEESWISWFCFPSLCGEHFIHVPVPGTATIPAPKSTAPKKSDLALTLRPDAPPKSSGGGGGGGGGGGAKEPKKVAIKRKSETVQRYKQNDYKASVAQKAKTSEERKKDYFYGERKIDQLEKINTLAQKEARITADRIKESREYLVEDRQNLINMLSKYGFEAEFDTDGFLANYEQVWNELYKELAALYEDNELTEAEEDLEEEINIKMEELEGALEDYENSLKELADDIESYEESLFEIYDNKIEALEHKVEFKIELEEDDLEYLDFWIDSLGDSVYNAIESIEAMGAKANHLFDGLNVYKQGIEDIYALSDDPFQVWATGGLEDVLTADQVDLLRDNRDGLADYMQQLIDLREEIKDKVIDTFDLWTERIDANIASIEHYSSVIEYFKNMVDTIGKDPFGLSDKFVNQLEQSAINQSLDYIESQKVYYESLVEQQAKAQEELDAARARGDESSAEHWEEVVRTTIEAMEEAQDSLLSGLDNTLTLIAEQFETAMQRAVDAFNDAIYAYGGLEGLSTDYDMIRENADLMAADYEKIYELSKLTRDINKVLDDTNIVAGKKKMNALLKEINELQADGVELSKYDLEYLRAKYELRLAEIELENTQNSKDTVRLSKDSEGNWSYVYTQNADAVEEAEQKYEDALYEMQNLSQEYLEEMSGMMLETSQAMMEEISALRIQDFTNYEAYQTEVKRIQDKYAESLRHQESELNKAIQNSSDLYEQDWQAYNRATGYKISLAENWVDSFREATLGDILDIDTFMSGFSDTFLGLTEQMSQQLADAAVQYFTNVDTAMKTYGTSIEGFGRTATTTIDNVSQKSKTAKDDLKVMASEMSDAFKEIADYVSDWQKEFSGQIDTMLEEIKTLIQSINEAIRKSAELTDGQSGAEGLIGSAEAIELLNATGLFGTWSKDGSVGVKVDGKATNFVDYNAALIEEIDDAVARYANAKTGTEEREKLGEELKELFKRYWQFRDIVNRVYDPTNLTTNMDAPTFTSMDTGGYTGEWGDSGKFAMLHEKELVLNANDTKNFLDALNISRDIINSMIEMNARASSLALGDLFPSLVQDFGQTLEQTVTITAEFPDATDHNEIEEAFNNLLNTASQYANRNRD